MLSLSEWSRNLETFAEEDHSCLSYMSAKAVIDKITVQLQLFLWGRLLYISPRDCSTPQLIHPLTGKHAAMYHNKTRYWAHLWQW